MVQSVSNPADQSLSAGSSQDLAPVRWWLYGICALIFLMVVVGGATRLTDSGLSITEWKPILGAVPPLSDADWQTAFSKYQQIPEYQRINRGMSLAEFKVIYWWEWGHRQLGRFIGLAFLVPYVVFLVFGRIPRRLAWHLFGVFLLGGLQGFLGWYMVQSGLADRVDVSQYRLAAHLTLALLIYCLVLWLALGTRTVEERYDDPEDMLKAYGDKPAASVVAVAVLLIAALFAQTVLGALVAGLKAGLSHNTWPLMDGKWIPDGLFVMEPRWLNMFENAMTVQFNHRMLAYGIGLLALLQVVRVWWIAGSGHLQRSSAAILVAAVVLQMGVGIWTLLEGVPIGLGLVHQGGVVVVLTAAVWHAHTLLRHPGFEY